VPEQPDGLVIRVVGAVWVFGMVRRLGLDWIGHMKGNPGFPSLLFAAYA